jgi:hypothetical protein
MTKLFLSNRIVDPHVFELATGIEKNLLAALADYQSHQTPKVSKRNQNMGVTRLETL